MQSFSKDTSLVEVNQAIKAWSFYEFIMNRQKCGKMKPPCGKKNLKMWYDMKLARLVHWVSVARVLQMKDESPCGRIRGSSSFLFTPPIACLATRRCLITQVVSIWRAINRSRRSSFFFQVRVIYYTRWCTDHFCLLFHLLFPYKQTLILAKMYETKDDETSTKSDVDLLCRLVSGSKNERDCLSGMPSPPYSFLQVMFVALL